MLFISGVELASAARAINNGVHDPVKQKENWTIMLITMGVIIVFSNDGIGFLSGLVAALILAVERLGLREWFNKFIEGVRDIPYKWKHHDAFQYRQQPQVKTPVESVDSERNPAEFYNSTLPKPVTSSHPAQQ